MSHPLRICLAQINIIPGDPVRNTETMLARITEAKTEGTHLIAFPEMAIPGYLLGDRWEQQAFLRECEACGHRIRMAAEGICIAFGNVAIDWSRCNEDGRVRKYNAVFVAENTEWVQPHGSHLPFIPKTLLPNYRQFDDSRHFYDLRKVAAEQGVSPHELLSPIYTKHATLGCVLCEDAWDQDYHFSPLAELAQHPDIQLFLNLSASPFTYNKNHKRNRVFMAHARSLRRPLAYVNHTGVQNNGKTVYTFDGASCIYDAQGHRIDVAPPFGEACACIDVPLHADATFGTSRVLQENCARDIARAILYGLEHMLATTGISRVVIGASGGIDSAVVATLFRQVLPPENILLANMPSSFNSQTTRSLADQLAQNLGVPFVAVDVEDSLALTMRQIHGLQPRCPGNLALPPLELTNFMQENIQARDRSSRILAALAAAWGGAFTCNANKSEMTVGYTTLYGDLGGWIAPIADLWKHQVYELARELNTSFCQNPVIPQGAFDVKPSAELSAQHNVDLGLGDPLQYDYHDKLFASWVEWWNRVTPEEILQWYADGELETRLDLPGPITNWFASAKAFIEDLERWWKLYQGIGVAKRIQAPPVIAVTRRAFGFDHREAQITPFFSAAYHRLKQDLLG